MKPAATTGRAFRTAALAAAAAAAASGLLSFLAPWLLTTRYEDRSLNRLRGQAAAIQRDFAALARTAERTLDALTRPPFPATPERQFRRLRELRQDPEVEGAALYGTDKRLRLWRGRVLNLEDLFLGPSPALTPSARPKMVLVREKDSSDILALIHKTESQEVVVIYRLLSFSPELRSTYVKEYSFLPARLQRGASLAYSDFREDITVFERLFALNKDEYVGQPRLQGGVQSLFFPLRTQEGRIIAHVTLNSPTRSAALVATRDGFLLATHFAAGAALIFLALHLLRLPAFRERRRWPALALLGLLAAFRLLFFPLSRLGPARAAEFFSPAQAGFVSLGRLTSSPGDIILTCFLGFALAALAAAYLSPGPEARPSGRAKSGRRLAAASLLLAAGPALLALLGVFLARLVAHSGLNLLRFDFSATFLLLQASVFFALAGAALLLGLFFGRSVPAFGRAAEPAVILLFSTAAVSVWRRESGALVLLVQALLLAGFLVWAVGRSRTRRVAAILLAPLLGLFAYAHLERATALKVRVLAEGFLKDTVQAHGHWVEFLLAESLQNLDREAKDIRAFLRTPTAPAEFGRRLWERTAAAKLNVYSGLQVFDPDGVEAARFTLNVPKISVETEGLPSKLDWAVTRIAKPFMGKAREFLVGYRDWFEEGRSLGRTVFYISLDFDTLPFLYSANPYFELLRTNALPSLDQFDFKFAVFDDAGRIVFNPARLSTGLPPSVVQAAGLGGPGVWATFEDKSQTYDLFAFREENRIAGILSGRRTAIGRAVDGLKLLLLLAAFGALPLFVWTKAGGRHDPRRLLWSFSNRVYISFVAVALVPLLLFTFVARPFFHRILGQQFIEKAKVHANLARNAMDDFIYLQEEERALVQSQPEELALFLSTSISNDVNLFLEGRLVSSSRREFFDAGLLPDLLDGEIYYQLQFANDPFTAENRRLGGFSYQTLTVPYLSLDPPLLISLPFPFEQAEIGAATGSLVEFLLFLSVFFVGLVVLLARAIGSMIVTPIRSLLAGTRAAALGNLDFQVDYSRRDEMKTLIDWFNGMIQSLKDHQRELADLGKKAAWAEMARKVAHEIKNPLTPIQLSAEHLLRVYEDGRADFAAALKESTAYIIGEVENLRRISQEFLDLSRASVLHKEPLAVDDFVRELVEPYRKLLGGRIAFRESYRSAARVAADRAKLKVALRNLLINAIESIRGEGEVGVTTSLEEDGAAIVFADTGAGIPEDILDRIFEPYFSTKEAGTGLGLPIARKIVEDHGGAVRLESEVGRGTRVTVLLPRLEG